MKFKIPFLGTAELGFFLTEIFIRIYLLKFYTDTIGLEPYLAGIAISVGLLWDAISDPLMGYVTDHFPVKFKIKNRYYIKKRIFYIISGSFFLGIFFFLLFTPLVKEQSTEIKFFYLCINYIFLNTFLTISSVPHSALCGEASSEPDERNKIFGFRLLWGNLGLISGILLSNIFQHKDIYDYLKMNLLIFLLIFLSSLTSSVAGFKVDNPLINPKNLNFFKNIKTLFKNHYFVILLICYFIGYIAIGLNSNMALYYYEYFLKFNIQETSIVLIVFLFCWTFSIPLWIYLSRYIGKKKSIVIAILLLGFGTIFSYPFFPEKKLIYPLFAAIIGGILVSAIVLMDSLTADLVDYDSIKSKEKREGIYFGFVKMTMKLARAIAILISGLLLTFIGFGNSTQINSQVEQNIANIFGFLVGGIFVLSAIIFNFFNYTEKKHNKVLRILKKLEL